MFTNGLGGRSLTVFDPESIPFADAMTTAAITTFRLGEEPTNARILRVPRTDDALTLEGAGRDVERVVLARAKRWSPFLGPQAAEVTGTTVGSLFRVSRGQVTGANKYFVMTRANARERGIERFCVPLVTSADEVFSSDGVLRAGPDQLVGLEIPRDISLARYPRLAEYIRGGEAADIHAGYVAAHRLPWYSISYPRPPIVATYMARQAPYFAANPDRLGLLNVVHGLHPREPMDDKTVAKVVTALNAARATFVGRGRTYHGGLEKFEPGEMEALPLEVLT
jgi:adenine-specific DNA-methyltransferase